MTRHFWFLVLLAFLLVDSAQNLLQVLFLAWVGFYLLGWDEIEATFYTFLLSLPFRNLLVGRWLTVVQPAPHLYLSGYGFSFGLEASHIFALLLLFFLIFSHRGRKKLRSLTQNDHWLLFFLGWAGLSTLLSSQLDLSLPGFISLSLAIFVFYVAKTLLVSGKIRAQVPHYLVALLLLLGLIGSLQFFLRHSLGIYLETRSLQAGEFLTTDGVALYRVVGLMPHPTFFASTLSLLLPIGFSTLISVWQKKQKLLVIASSLAIVLGLISLVGTFSRSAWLAFFFSSLVYGSVVWLKYRHDLQQWYQRHKKLAFLSFGSVMVLGLLLLKSVLGLRLASLKTVWSFGNWPGRFELIKHSWQMIKDHPWFGVGLNRFTAVMVKQGVPIEFRGFIFPVHNTFLLFLVELGLVGGGIFIVWLLQFLYKTWSVVKKDLLALAFWVGALNFVINANFHTLFNQDPSFNLLMLVAAYLQTLYNQAQDHDQS